MKCFCCSDIATEKNIDKYFLDGRKNVKVCDDCFEICKQAFTLAVKQKEKNPKDSKFYLSKWVNQSYRTNKLLLFEDKKFLNDKIIFNEK